jgi:hypothetical protein
MNGAGAVRDRPHPMAGMDTFSPPGDRRTGRDPGRGEGTSAGRHDVRSGRRRRSVRAGVRLPRPARSQLPVIDVVITNADATS